jgi:hypothetical protein
MSDNTIITQYHELVNNNIQYKEDWTYGSGLHRHHIIPRHSGGLDEENNYTYLCVDDHILAHELLYKIYDNPNDLRAMYMLGAKLSTEYRIIIGNFCRDNDIGFHNQKWDTSRPEWRKKGIETQKTLYEANGDKNFYYWSTTEGRKERASLGGSISSKTNTKFLEQQGTFKDKDKAIAAAKLSAKFPVTDGTNMKKFQSEEDRQEFLSFNSDWKSGGKPQIRKVQYTNGTDIFVSRKAAADFHKVTPDTITNWIKSPKKPEWKTVES